MSADGTMVEYLIAALDTLCGNWTRASDRYHWIVPLPH